MNPRQRRAVLLLGLAALGLLGVFALVVNYVSEIETEVGDKIVVLELTQPVEANQAVPDDAVTERRVPSKWAPAAALTDRTQLVGVVAGSNLQPGSILQEGMLESPPQIEQGQREVAIMVDASTGVAGRIQAGSTVDVIASFSGREATPGQDAEPARSVVIVPGATVIAVGTPRVKDPSGQAEQQSPSEVVPVTFALNKKQELKVAYAQTFASDVRLALLPEGDNGERTLDETTHRGEDPKKGDDDGKIR